MPGVAPVQAQASTAVGGGRENESYTVRTGDTLWGIAQAHGVSLAALERANPQILHPDLIRPGQQVHVPTEKGENDGARPSTYTVRSGDTLSGIGERYGVDWRVLAQVNGLSDPNLITPGETLRLGAANGNAPGGAGSVRGAGPTGASGGTSNAAEVARHYLGQNASSLKASGALPMDPNCPSSECCANFVSAVLVKAGQLPASLHTDSVSQLDSTLRSRGWTPVSIADARPGDVVIMQGGGISHTEMVSGHGQMIGSNNTNPDGSQRVGYNSLSYATSHGGVILRAPAGTPGTTGGTTPTHGGSPVSGPSGTGSLSQRAQQAVSYFESKGWTHAQAAGIVANLETESSLSTTAVGDGGSAYGLAQWHPDRQAGFQAYAGRPIRGSSFAEQLGYVNHELHHSESSAGAQLRNATSASAAGAAVSIYYERPLHTQSEASSRAALAERIFTQTH